MRVMISMLGDTFAEIIEEMLVTPLHIPDSPAWLRIAKKIDDLAEAELEARVEARVRLRVKADILLRLMELRGIQADDAVRARVRGCEEPAQLDAWFALAVNATTPDEVFAAK